MAERELGGNGFITDYDAVTVADTATMLFDLAPNGRVTHLYIGAGDVVYLGDANVTAATGYPFDGGSSFTSYNWPFRGALYAITASGTAEVRFLREGV